MSFNLSSKRYEVVEDHIVSELYPQMFELPSQYYYAGNEGLLPINSSLMLPQWRDGTITLEYIDQMGTRTTLLEGASDVLLEAYYYLPYQQFNWGIDQSLIPWRAMVNGRPETRVTIRRKVDGQDQQYTVTNLTDVQQVIWLATDWIGFISTQNGTRGLELINFVTQERAQRIEMREDEAGWYGSASPDGQHFALFFNRSPSYSNDAEARLALLSLPESRVRNVDSTLIGYGYWSPDSQRFAFLYRLESGRRLGIRVVNNTGHLLSDTSLPAGLNSGSISLSFWSTCDTPSGS